MFVRKTQTRNKSTAESYFTYRLVASERTGKQVRQLTPLNLGRHFDLPQPDWPRLCARIGLLCTLRDRRHRRPRNTRYRAARYCPTLAGLSPAGTRQLRLAH